VYVPPAEVTVNWMEVLVTVEAVHSPFTPVKPPTPETLMRWPNSTLAGTLANVSVIRFPTRDPPVTDRFRDPIPVTIVGMVRSS
jgi:hypothetical protein